MKPNRMKQKLRDAMPAVADNVAALQDKGVRYLYTHVPRLLAAASDAFLSAARAV